MAASHRRLFTGGLRQGFFSGPRSLQGLPFQRLQSQLNLASLNSLVINGSSIPSPVAHSLLRIILGNCPNAQCTLNDIFEGLEDYYQYLQHLRQLLFTPLLAKLLINFDKCVVSGNKVAELGWTVFPENVRILWGKVQIIEDHLCLFLEMINFSRRFIPRPYKFQGLPAKDKRSRVIWAPEIERFISKQQNNTRRRIDPSRHFLVEPLGPLQAPFPGNCGTPRNVTSPMIDSCSLSFAGIQHFPRFVERRFFADFIDHRP